ncbi:glycosyltransferase family 39 protein [Micromonospora sp. WMMD975]|uniref:glycosyltransferase family 39 protein n=1 Tax=Micromonospora sp. WMMD975 TaxID=3016087 RepID=UPI00249C92B3|nr:glycosyltransferase family 39 protein [Micromonospora sp. WMMD975]WFE36765.1 glycosyltransferase family 39 protein [Micromonospora sp. WMMD975]
MATWSAATRSLPDLVRLTHTIDAATGPYYLLMHGWTALAGTSATALRLPSALATAVATTLTARLGAQLVSDRAGLLAGLLFAVLPATSRYGQEARPYALATLLAVLATLLLVGALRRPTWGRWVGYAVVVAALVLLHLVALTLLAAHAVVVLLTAARGPAAAGVDPAAAGVDRAARSRPDPPGGTPPGRRQPQRSTHQRHRARVERHGCHGTPETPTAFRPPATSTASGAPRVSRHGTGGGAPDDPRAPVPARRVVARWLVALVPAIVLVTPLGLVAQGQRGRQLDWVDPARLSDLASLPGGLAQSGVVGGFLLGLAAFGAARLGRRALLPGAAVLLPVLLLFVAGTVVPLWVTRYLIFTVPFACLLAGAALARVRLGPALVVVALAGLLGLPDQAALRRTHEWPRSAPVDYTGAADIIGAGQRPGDAIVYSPRDGWLFPDLGLAYHLGPRLPRDVLAVRDQRADASLWAVECGDPARCLAGVDRIWLVVTGRRADPLAAVPGAKGAALRDGFTVRQVWPRQGLTVALLDR